MGSSKKKGALEGQVKVLDDPALLEIRSVPSLAKLVRLASAFLEVGGEPLALVAMVDRGLWHGITAPGQDQAERSD